VYVVLCRNMFPENLVQACFQQIQTVYTPKNSSAKTRQLPTTVGYENDYPDYYRFEEHTTAASVNLTDEESFDRDLKYADGINVLG